MKETCSLQASELTPNSNRDRSDKTWKEKPPSPALRRLPWPGLRRAERSRSPQAPPDWIPTSRRGVDARALSIPAASPRFSACLNTCVHGRVQIMHFELLACMSCQLVCPVIQEKSGKGQKRKLFGIFSRLLRFAGGGRGIRIRHQGLPLHHWRALRLRMGLLDAPPRHLQGCLIYELFCGAKLTRTEDLRNIASIPKSLLPDYQRLLSSTPSRRLNPSKLIDNSEFFQNKLVETIQFMEVLNLKDSVEKDSFFRKLPNIVEQLPCEIVLKKLLPVLASALEFGSAAAPALVVLLKMGSWLPADQFSVKILPTIVKLFDSNDRAIRVSLLQHIDQFGESLAAQTVDEQVFPHVATGFSDTSAFLRELTLKSMLVLAPKLSQRTISGSLLKYLSKLQVDEEPAIRANTTILLGNIANYMNDGTRKRVLINAFTVRALRDTFSPARAAGIMALSVTSSYYEMTEIATRILPNIVVLTFDPDSDVRTKAFQATDQFLQIAKQHHEKLSTGDNSTAEGTDVQLKSGNAGLLGWAMSSLTQKGKNSDHGVVSSANANKSQVSTSSSVTSDNQSATVAYAPSNLHFQLS
ncbi:hypothetical protein GUJ93_ZPchr0007g3059 [Zizania palustris]|uniref:TOG domain-containing protein n=1 Tax=Zizania palustris TaxID=103762 RepID=A0A8J5T353_ZIZPA|nr:hypothetical protein GUJ93_ZPchr0007g3059 [Zizania palustris]